jgi:hypothetical protein
MLYAVRQFAPSSQRWALFCETWRDGRTTAGPNRRSSGNPYCENIPSGDDDDDDDDGRRAVVASREIEFELELDFLG